MRFAYFVSHFPIFFRVMISPYLIPQDVVTNTEYIQGPYCEPTGYVHVGHLIVAHTRLKRIWDDRRLVVTIVRLASTHICS